jgi:GTPase
MEELMADMDRRTRVHMAVVERVLLPSLVVAERTEIIDEVLANHGRVRHDLDALVDHAGGIDEAVRDLEADLADQVAFEDGVLVPALEEQLNERATDGLAFEFSRVADTGVTTPAPPT